jgi:putative endonuclease
LRRAGCSILARNYRCPAGEVDLIALCGDTLIFAEVKTRNSREFADPEAAVNRAKQKRYRAAARYYLHRTGRDDLAVRFDVVAVVIAPDCKPDVRHIENAFT